MKTDSCGSDYYSEPDEVRRSALLLISRRQDSPVLGFRITFGPAGQSIRGGYASDEKVVPGKVRTGGNQSWSYDMVGFRLTREGA